MTDLPSPLTPPDCDLRGYDFMPLFGTRLFGSEFYAKCSDAEFRAGLRLWWVAWQQCPAGSLPDDDVALTRFADLGHDVKGWKRLRANALHGFLKCSDGRLYHPVLCSQALEAFDRRRRERERKAEMRAKRRNGGAADDASPPVVPRDSLKTDAGQSADVRSDRTGQDRAGQRKKEQEASPPDAATASSPENRQGACPIPAEPPPVRDQLWGEGVPAIRAMIGKPEAASRAFLGRLLRDARDDCALVLAKIRQAADLRPVDPAAWLSAACREKPLSGAGSMLRDAIAGTLIPPPDDDPFAGLVASPAPRKQLELTHAA